jgi:hypothetical protein
MNLVLLCGYSITEYLCRLVDVTPSILAHSRREIEWLLLIPNNEMLVCWQPEIVSTPNDAMG